jgi:hypothetical protein
MTSNPAPCPDSEAGCQRTRPSRRGCPKRPNRHLPLRRETEERAGERRCLGTGDSAAPLPALSPLRRRGARGTEVVGIDWAHLNL